MARLTLCASFLLALLLVTSGRVADGEAAHSSVHASGIAGEHTAEEQQNCNVQD
jgi:hypothetical protein